MTSLKDIEYTKDSVCSICYEDNKIWDGPSNSEFKTNCEHMFCTDCNMEMKHKHIRCCPMCRAPEFGEWLDIYYSESDSSCCSESEEEEEMYEEEEYESDDE